MTVRRWTVAVATVAATLLATPLALPGVSLANSGPEGSGSCAPGGRTLSHFGDHVYPETGNAGYRSVHTDIHLVYDAASNQFLSGTHVALTDQATQCLTEFSLDFERTSAAGAAGPDLTVQSIAVNGRAASFRFAQPTYPGDPNGPDDPDPRAHQAGQRNPVGGPQHNPLPPACTPALTGRNASAQNGQQCPANKLLITPVRPIQRGDRFTVTVFYTGRPGVHLDGDGSTEGWFRSNSPVGDGGFVTTEPVGSEDWMPLNNHPSAKPTYDLYATVNAGKTAIGNGVLLSKTNQPGSAEFLRGSTTWHWRSEAPVASYLVEASVGSFDLTKRTTANGVTYYQAQPSSLPTRRQQINRSIMNQQSDITAFESTVNGAFPFRSDGVLIGLPAASFAEEMQTMITFPGGRIDLDTLYHENMHQWWGDNVSEASYNLTFYKEGMATLGEFLFAARLAQQKAGGPGTKAGAAAFETSLRHQFDTLYANAKTFTTAPSDPTPYALFSGASTYDRPGIAYIALRQILGPAAFARTLQSVQAQYGGATITEAQWESAFMHGLPRQTASCRTKLGVFFHQWFDTDYPTPAGVTRPTLTGPGLPGGGFTC
jgi:hypothetical protein